MTDYLSKKLAVVSFTLMIMIVILHAHLLGYAQGGLRFVQLVITNEITRVAVPLFFGISGFLFFRNYRVPATIFFVEKIKKRIDTVFIPFLTFSILGLLFTYLSFLCFPQFFTGENKEIINYGITECLHAIFIEPVGTYQLWFLKDLFILILLSPLIYIVLKVLKWLFVVILFFLWVNDVQCFVSIEAILFFSLGSAVALYKRELLEKQCDNEMLIYGVLLFWLSVCFGIVYFQLDRIWHCSCIFLGILSIWILYDKLYDKLPKDVTVYSFSFFIYLTHEPLLTVIKKVLLSVLGTSMSSLFIIYLFSPVFTIMCCVICGKIIKSRLPKAYAFLTGGR